MKRRLLLAALFRRAPFGGSTLRRIQLQIQIDGFIQIGKTRRERACASLRPIGSRLGDPLPAGPTLVATPTGRVLRVASRRAAVRMAAAASAAGAVALHGHVVALHGHIHPAGRPIVRCLASVLCSSRKLRGECRGEWELRKWSELASSRRAQFRLNHHLSPHIWHLDFWAARLRLALARRWPLAGLSPRGPGRQNWPGPAKLRPASCGKGPGKL